MATTAAITRWPVLLLYNVDPSWPPDQVAEAERLTVELAAALAAEGHAVTPVGVRDGDLAACLAAYDPRQYVVLNWCEELPGIPRSDVTVAEVLEAAGFCYTGPTPPALALSWDKPRVKRLLVRRRLPTPRWCLWDRAPAAKWSCFPAIVKPAWEHCSFGVTSEAVVLNAQELAERVEFVRETFRQPALVEDFIDGREFHVTVWGNGTVRMLPPVEMDFSRFADVHDRLCTYDSKFTPGSRHYDGIQARVPAPLSDQESARLEETAVRAYRALGCRDYARLDIRLRDGLFYVLDVNPNPDVSPDASVACAAEAAGYSYGALVSELVHLAAHRHPVFGAGRH
ncbi:MAG: D-alanine--D-alanine ligase family protein [Anaerolineae bacterium]